MKITLGYNYHPGERDTYEDNCEVRELKTPGGLNLSLAIVADGVGGEAKGERASRLAVEAVLDYMSKSPEKDVIVLLKKAVSYANQVINTEVQRTGNTSMSSTIAIAAVKDGSILYVANAGDSCIFLFRGTRLKKLTIDHNFATFMQWQNKLSASAANANANASHLMNALGVNDKVFVDTGFYINTIDRTTAAERGAQGLPLKEGDTILVCSDGLVEPFGTEQQFMESSKVVEVLQTQRGSDAAKTIVSFARGARALDNLSLAVLQTPNPQSEEFIRQRQKRRRVMLGAAVATVLTVFAILAGVVLRTTSDLNEIAHTATYVAYITETVAAYTPTPTATATATATPRSTLEPQQIGNVFGPISGRLSLMQNGFVEANEMLQADISLTMDNAASLDGNDANIYIQPQTRLTLNLDPVGQLISLILFEGGDIFMDTGRYLGGIEVTLAQEPGVRLAVKGSSAAVYYPDPTNTSRIAFSCYEGTCTYSTHIGGEPTLLPQGNRILFDISQLTVIDFQPIPNTEADTYRDRLLTFGAGPQDVHYVQPYASTPTPTPTNTPIYVPVYPTQPVNINPYGG